jgi:glycosyltransferase involved in cell wall biosynthesis
VKILAIVAKTHRSFSPEEVLRREKAGEFPRVSLFRSVLEADMLDEDSLSRVPFFRRIIYSCLPTAVSQAIEGFLIRKKYDSVITWSESRALPFSLLLFLTRDRTVPHVSLMYWMSKPKQTPFFRLTRKYFDRIVTWSSVQQKYAIDVLKIPKENIVLVKHPVDQEFFRPVQAQSDMICAVGSEMRDYETLVRALRGVDIQCQIAAGNIRIINKFTSHVKSIDSLGPLPSNVKAGFLAYQELRDLYMRSRFVVIPLLQSKTDNGINAILESMAMGKAVICSKTEGQVDAVIDGENGIYVPQGDSTALREAILYLWNHPEIAYEMGQKGRKYIEDYHTLDTFVSKIKLVVEEVSSSFKANR